MPPLAAIPSSPIITKINCSDSDQKISLAWEGGAMAATYNVETAASVSGPWIVDQKGVRDFLKLAALDYCTFSLHCPALYCTGRHWDSALGLLIELYIDDVVAERESLQPLTLASGFV